MMPSLLRLAIVAGLVVGLDQWTKDWASRTLAGRPPLHVIGDLVQFTYTRNSGVAFGLGAGVPFPYYLFSIAAAVAILWLFLARRVHGGARQFALSLVMGGAIGNLIDRVATGHVVDFVLLSWRHWQFPVIPCGLDMFLATHSTLLDHRVRIAHPAANFRTRQNPFSPPPYSSVPRPSPRNQTRSWRSSPGWRPTIPSLHQT